MLPTLKLNASIAMPAKSKVQSKTAAKKPAKPAPKAAAKPVKKAASKPAVKASSAKSAKKSVPVKKAPAKKPAPKAAKPVKSAVKLVKKSPAKSKPAPKAAKPAAKTKPALKVAAKQPSKSATPPVKKSAPASKSKPAPAKPAAKAAVKAAPAKPTPKPEPAIKKEAPKPEPVKAAAPAPAPAPAKAPAKSKSGSKTPSVASPAKGFVAGPPIKSVSRTKDEEVGATIEVKKTFKMTPFLKKQKQRLLELRSMLLDSMDSVAEGSLRVRPEGGEASAFGMHQADAGSDAYDRDFALSLLSQEQDALYEINEALKRIDLGSYGICEMSNKAIPEIRLEALPFTRFTVECQARLERDNMGGRYRRPVRSLFGLEESADGDDSDDDDDDTETVDKKED
jgi:RNA polymerase-binding transcription factor DksA